MGKVLNWFTNKKMFFISLFFAFLYPLSRYLIRIDSGLCLDIGQGEKVAYWVTTCHFATIISFFAIAVASISFLMLPLTRKSLFVAWRKFTFIYLFIYLFIVTITPWYEGDGFFSIQKGVVALWLTGLYVLLSFLVILYKSLKKSS